MGFETIEYAVVEEGIGVLTLKRPRIFNAVNSQMVQELDAFWRDRLYDNDTHVLVMNGQGSRGFCAGLDMRESGKGMPNMSTEEFYSFQGGLVRLTLAMRRAPQPIVCAVHGFAVGLGFSFALASDIRIVTHDTRFSAAYINVGLGGADMACSYFLPRLMGAGRAYEFMLTGEFMSAQEASALGLVSRVVNDDELMDTAMAMARTMNSKNPMGLRLTKEAINMNLDAAGLEHAVHMEDRNQTLLFARSKLGEGKKVSKYL